MSIPGKLETFHALNDIGKPAKDLLTKDYPVGGVKLEVKTTAPNGVVSAVSNKHNRIMLIHWIDF